MPKSAKSTPSWRDVLKIHPAADLFPLLPAPELKALGEDIRKHGLRIPTIWWRDPGSRQLYLLDGRNRLDALEAVGRNIITGRDGTGRDADLREILTLGSEHWYVLPPCGPRGGNYPDTYQYVISANIHRRHLTAEQKRDLIAKLLKATPEKSDRQIAETIKASPTTVGTVRAKMEAKGEVSKLDTRTDAKGIKQPARRSPKQQRAAIAATAIMESLEKKAAPPRDDIGAGSNGEIERLRARVDELQAEKRQLEIKIKGYESEIEELKARLATAPPPADDGLDIPPSLRRAAP
jgi:hypothetical protein